MLGTLRSPKRQHLLVVLAWLCGFSFSLQMAYATEYMPENNLNKAPANLSPEELRQRTLNRQEVQLATIARKFLDEGKPMEALALVQSSKGFVWVNLVTLVGIYIAEPDKLGNTAASLFSEYIKKSFNFDEVMHVLLYVKNQRRNSLPQHFNDVIEARLRELKPEWDGNADTRAKDLMDEKKRLTKLPIENITDPATCLDLAGSGTKSQKRRYLARFLELGGNPDDEKYIKIRLNGILLGIEEAGDARNLIARLAKHMDSFSFRKWIRDNSKKRIKGVIQIPASFSRLVLASYVAADSEKIDGTDWLYIAKRSIQLQETELQRICFEYLKRIPRDEKMQEILDVLMRKFTADTDERASVSDRSLTNPIYVQLAARVPINKAAALAITSWARNVLKE